MYRPVAGLQYFSIIFRLVSQRGRKLKLRRGLHDPVGRTPRHALEFFAQKNEDLTWLCSTFKQNLAKKLDPT